MELGLPFVRHAIEEQVSDDRPTQSDPLAVDVPVDVDEPRAHEPAQDGRRVLHLRDVGEHLHGERFACDREHVQQCAAVGRKRLQHVAEQAGETDGRCDGHVGI